MKWNYIATGAAVLLLIGTGIYWFNNSSSAPELNPQTEIENGRIEIIDGEEVVLETPLTQSFSNAESNRESQVNQNVVKNNMAPSNKISDVIVDTVTKPFFVGIYYVNNLREKGFNMCNLKKIEIQKGESKERGSLLFGINERSEITKIVKGEDQVFVYVDSDKLPDSVCARLIQSPLFSSLDANPIHFIIE